MSILLSSSAIGVLIGYVCTAQMMVILTWHWSFYIQILFTIPIFLILLCTDNAHLELNDVGGEEVSETGYEAQS